LKDCAAKKASDFEQELSASTSGDMQTKLAASEALIQSLQSELAEERRRACSSDTERQALEMQAWKWKSEHQAALDAVTNERDSVLATLQAERQGTAAAAQQAEFLTLDYRCSAARLNRFEAQRTGLLQRWQEAQSAAVAASALGSWRRLVMHERASEAEMLAEKLCGAWQRSTHRRLRREECGA
jgi:hypothetical protein